MIAGSAPIDMGCHLLAEPEMMFVQYMPIKMPETMVKLPPNLSFVKPLLEQIDMGTTEYVYVTAKRLWVAGQCMGNRPGWHADGFGTEDINYIWSDRAPTEFCVQPFDLSEDCDESMAQMESQARPDNIRIFGGNRLLRLDAGVIHRVPVNVPSGYRTFVKISVSKDQYNLEGNAHNYMFDYDWKMLPRNDTRNHPARST